MKKLTHFKCATAIVAFLLVAVGCNQSSKKDTTHNESGTDQAATAKQDPAKVKAEIQELETAWATAENAGDVNAVAAFYADDAISMDNNKPMLIGNAAIKKNIESSIAKRAKGSTVAYQVMDVYVGGNYVTEVGKTIRKDAGGKIISTGKYMAIWEKRNNKWVCIRDIGNEDAERK
jgi:uncharacterized protein (TIGR02246 family)